jgi:hypothetical protein
MLYPYLGGGENVSDILRVMDRVGDSCWFLMSELLKIPYPDALAPAVPNVFWQLRTSSKTLAHHICNMVDKDGSIVRIVPLEEIVDSILPEQFKAWMYIRGNRRGLHYLPSRMNSKFFDIPKSDLSERMKMISSTSRSLKVKATWTLKGLNGTNPIATPLDVECLWVADEMKTMEWPATSGVALPAEPPGEVQKESSDPIYDPI